MLEAIRHKSSITSITSTRHSNTGISEGTCTLRVETGEAGVAGQQLVPQLVTLLAQLLHR